MLSPACPAGDQEPDSRVTALPGVTPQRPEAPKCFGEEPRLTVAGEPRSSFWSQGFTTSPTPWESTFPEQKFKILFFEIIVTKGYIPYQLRHLHDSPVMLITKERRTTPSSKSKSRHNTCPRDQHFQAGQSLKVDMEREPPPVHLLLSVSTGPHTPRPGTGSEDTGSRGHSRGRPYVFPLVGVRAWPRGVRTD